MSHLFDRIYGCEAADTPCDAALFDDNPARYGRREALLAGTFSLLAAHRLGGPHMGHRARYPVFLSHGTAEMD